MELLELEADKKQILHRKLVEAAFKWVLRRGGCGVAFKELYTATSREYPDVIGFQAWGKSVLIECKTSRSDFLADSKKPFRKNPKIGMGTYRYYCTPPGLVKIDELPMGWGLLHVNDKKATCVHRPLFDYVNNNGNPYKNLYKHEKNIVAEHGLMYSALRRLHIKGHVDAIYDKDYKYDHKD